MIVVAICAASVVGIIAVVAFVLLMTGGAQTPRPSSATTCLYPPGQSEVVPVATKESALHDLVGARSDEAVAALVRGGQYFVVQRGVRADAMRGGGLGVRRVLIIEGPHAGRIGFVPSEFLQPRRAGR